MLLVCGGVNASAYNDAVQTASLAAFKQSGLEEMINKFIERQIPKTYRDIGERLFPIISAGINQKVELTWTY